VSDDLGALAAERRASKLVSLVASCFTGNYVRHWATAMGPGRPLRSTPLFDGRAVLYPSDRHLRDYLSWRQADTHVNYQVGRPAPCPQARNSEMLLSSPQNPEAQHSRGECCICDKRKYCTCSIFKTRGLLIPAHS